MHSQMAAINGNNCSVMCGCIEHERVWYELCILLLPFFIVRHVCVRVCAPRPLSGINHPPCAKSLSSRCASPHQWRDEATAKLWSLSFGNWPSVIKKKYSCLKTWDAPREASQVWSRTTGERRSTPRSIARWMSLNISQVVVSTDEMQDINKTELQQVDKSLHWPLQWRVVDKHTGLMMNRSCKP